MASTHAQISWNWVAIGLDSLGDSYASSPNIKNPIPSGLQRSPIGPECVQYVRFAADTSQSGQPTGGTITMGGMAAYSALLTPGSGTVSRFWVNSATGDTRPSRYTTEHDVYVTRISGEVATAPESGVGNVTVEA